MAFDFESLIPTWENTIALYARDLVLYRDGIQKSDDWCAFRTRLTDWELVLLSMWIEVFCRRRPRLDG
jgi:hypothetical protein